MKKIYRQVKNITDNIIHITYSLYKDDPIQSNLTEAFSEVESQKEKGYQIAPDDSIDFFNQQGEVILNEFSRNLLEKSVFKYAPDGSPVLENKNTANGEVASYKNLKKEFVKTSYSAELQFLISGDEIITGLGQSEDGVFNYRGKKEYLYQNNMKIAIPFLISTMNYGILIDTESTMVFENDNRTLSFSIDTTDWISYYIITGINFDEILYNLRHLTGRASMLPRWTFGYMQSKERYESSDELLDISTRFREKRIPLDCIIQDWQTWENDNWGEKIVDKGRYPDLNATVESLQNEHTKVMFSIWPNMAPGGTNYNEFVEKEAMLPNSNVYDAFDENAREIYWDQCERELFSSGLDAFWCDNTEPFSDPDWNGEIKRAEKERYDLVVSASKKSMDWNKLNAYALYHIQGLYENWRKKTDKKRVVILTRSLYISGQKYGAIGWSGDISAKWSVLKKQIVEGLKMSHSGLPYWTLDIGGFFTVRDKWENRGCNSHLNTNPLWFWDGDYNEGVQDFGYRELYVRWLQFGTFLPIFRSHGTDTPREPWNFGKSGEIFYDVIVKFIKLRYKLMPYIYSLAAGVHFNHSTIERNRFAVDRFTITF